MCNGMKTSTAFPCDVHDMINMFTHLLNSPQTNTHVTIKNDLMTHPHYPLSFLMTLVFISLRFMSDVVRHLLCYSGDVSMDEWLY